MLRARIATIPQDAVLFSGTIRYNFFSSSTLTRCGRRSVTIFSRVTDKHLLLLTRTKEKNNPFFFSS
jgi:hypothetical protein